MPRHRLLARFYWALVALVLLLSIASAVFAARQTPPAPLYLPVTFGPPPDRVVIAAAHIDPARSGEADEALLLWNIGATTVDLAGWRLVANGREAHFPVHARLLLPPGTRVWCAAGAAAFALSFGHAPDCEWAADDDPDLPNLMGAPRLTNSGGVVQLLDPTARVVDSLLYGQASGPVTGWQGAAAQLYTRGAVAATGQVWERKRDPARGLPLDGDRAADWNGDLDDIAWGRRVRFPGWAGWDDGELARPPTIAASARITVAVAPEGLYAPIATALDAATVSIDLGLYTFEHPELAEIVASAARRGVRVRLLLEGGPPGGVSNLQRWCVRQMVQAGVDVRYLAMQADAPAGMQPRYRYSHAKSAIIDGRVVLVGSENFGRDAMPLPDPLPQGGRRGAYLLVEAPEVAALFARLFALDWAPERFVDLHPYTPDHARYGDPPPDYLPPAPSPLGVEAAPFTEAAVAHGPARFELVSAPENALRPDAGLFALLSRAGAGDEIYWMQLYEHKFWGYADSNPVVDPNPRLEALIAAARRGATVRVLLDSHFDNAEAYRSNRATADYLNNLAAAEGLDLQAAMGNPTRRGIHMKLVLVKVGGETWTALGSLNGGEISHKVNREVLLLVDHPTVYARLFEVFRHDWVLVTRQ